MSKDWKIIVGDWGAVLSAAYTAGKITKKVYDRLSRRVEHVSQLAERTSEASFPEDVELGAELAAEGAEVAVEIAGVAAL
jgi:hypothetical protein